MVRDIFVEGNVIYIIFLAIAIVAFHLNKAWLRYPIMVAALATIGFLQMGCPSPVRALQNIAANLGQLPTIVTVAAKVALVTVVAAVYGKIFCGWVCPKGTIQEFLYRKPLRVAVPPAVDRRLRKVKYGVLVLVIALPWGFGYHLFNRETSPFGALFNLSGGTIALGLLGVILFASLFVYRPFCRYACPTGAWLGLVAYLNRTRFVAQTCTVCQRAGKQCDIGALTCPTKPSAQGLTVDKGECLMCGECRGNCPEGVAIELF